MNRSYLIEAVLSEISAGYQLWCFLDDDCVSESFHRDRETALAAADEFMDGLRCETLV